MVRGEETVKKTKEEKENKIVLDYFVEYLRKSVYLLKFSRNQLRKKYPKLFDDERNLH